MNEREEEIVFVAVAMIKAAGVIAANAKEDECLAIKELCAEAARELESLSKEDA